jgi:hypothetical protein
VLFLVVVFAPLAVLLVVALVTNLRSKRVLAAQRPPTD